MRRYLVVLLAVGSYLVFSPVLFAESLAQAELLDKQGVSLGKVFFSKTDKGVEVKGSLKGLRPGPAALHIHQKGSCQGPDFKSAKGHFNPFNKEHGFLNPKGPHAGDLPNINVDKAGQAEFKFISGLISLDKQDKQSILTEEKTALLLHELADDYITDPAGGAGNRTACGVIEEVSD